jgi:hypothetical protein
VTMPQKKETNLTMWNIHDLENPIYNFIGHTDVPREFVWRVKGKFDRPPGIFMSSSGLLVYLLEQREYQLVTWSKDQHLRLWNIDPELLKV